MKISNKISSKSPVDRGSAWPRRIAWTLAALAASLIVLEHRVYASGWWLHALLGLCVMLLYLLIRTDAGTGRGGQR